MKHIKLFKESIETLYWEISLNEYNELIELRATLPDDNLNSLKRFGFKEEKGKYTNIIKLVNCNEQNDVGIIKLNDDYYLVMIILYKVNAGVFTYKCDTFEGVKQCLKNETNFELIKESNEDILYHKIRVSDWDGLSKRSIYPDKSSLKYLLHLGFKIIDPCRFTRESHFMLYTNEETTIEVNCLTDNYYLVLIYIVGDDTSPTFDDDIVGITTTYKCDTIDGLKQCLEKEIGMK